MVETLITQKYETSHDINLHTQAHHYFGELERSGNPRSEFHTVAESLQRDDGDMKSAVKYIEKIKG